MTYNRLAPATPRQRAYVAQLSRQYATVFGREADLSHFDLNTRGGASDAISQMETELRDTSRNSPTAKQVGYLESLCARYERNHGEPFDLSDYDLNVRGGVSDAIDALRRAPRRPAPTVAGTDEEVAPGYYVTADDSIIRVKRSMTSGHVYGVSLSEDGKWVYTPGVLHTGVRTATVDDLGGVGRAVGVCLLCSRALTDPKSVERGVGPHCAKRYSAEHDAAVPKVY